MRVSVPHDAVRLHPHDRAERPKELVRYSVSAAGFEFEVSSDHYSPWLAAQGHAPNAWAMLGTVAHATDAVELFTYVTCPTMRYHPAVVAQQAATLQILA